MVAIGATVASVYGVGVVKETRDSGCVVIQLESWLLAGGQHPMAYLRDGEFTETGSTGSTVKSIYGSGVVKDVRKDGTTKIQLESWLLAGGQHPIAYLQPSQYE